MSAHQVRTVAPKVRSNVLSSAKSTSLRLKLMPRSQRLVTPKCEAEMPHGTMAEKWVTSGATLSAMLQPGGAIEVCYAFSPLVSER
jgi:hypothetical protein